jgi:hypothetical protein
MFIESISENSGKNRFYTRFYNTKKIDISIKLPSFQLSRKQFWPLLRGSVL